MIGFHGVAACRALRREHAIPQQFRSCRTIGAPRRAVRDRVAGGSNPLAPAGPLRDLRGDVGRRIGILPLDQSVQAVPAGGEQGLDPAEIDALDTHPLQRHRLTR
jgi:hypothetical protein